MLKDFLWEVFIETGSLEAYLLYKEIDEKRNNEIEFDIVNNEVAIAGS